VVSWTLVCIVVSAGSCGRFLLTLQLQSTGTVQNEFATCFAHLK